MVYNNKGFLLSQFMVLLSVAGLLTVVGSGYVSHYQKEAKNYSQIMEREILLGEIREFLSNPIDCSYNYNKLLSTTTTGVSLWKLEYNQSNLAGDRTAFNIVSNSMSIVDAKSSNLTHGNGTLIIRRIEAAAAATTLNNGLKRRSINITFEKVHIAVNNKVIDTVGAVEKTEIGRIAIIFDDSNKICYSEALTDNKDKSYYLWKYSNSSVANNNSIYYKGHVSIDDESSTGSPSVEHNAILDVKGAIKIESSGSCAPAQSCSPGVVCHDGVRLHYCDTESKIQEVIPQDMVVPFNSKGCPNGWEEFVPAEGKLIVSGVMRDFTPTGSPSVTLTVGHMPSHTHDVVRDGLTDQGHQHRYRRVRRKSVKGIQLFGGGRRRYFKDEIDENTNLATTGVTLNTTGNDPTIKLDMLHYVYQFCRKL